MTINNKIKGGDFMVMKYFEDKKREYERNKMKDDAKKVALGTEIGRASCRERV